MSKRKLLALTAMFSSVATLSLASAADAGPIDEAMLTVQLRFVGIPTPLIPLTIPDSGAAGASVGNTLLAGSGFAGSGVILPSTTVPIILEVQNNFAGNFMGTPLKGNGTFIARLCLPLGSPCHFSVPFVF